MALLLRAFDVLVALLDWAIAGLPRSTPQLPLRLGTQHRDPSEGHDRAAA